MFVVNPVTMRWFLFSNTTPSGEWVENEFFSGFHCKKLNIYKEPTINCVD